MREDSQYMSTRSIYGPQEHFLSVSFALHQFFAKQRPSSHPGTLTEWHFILLVPDPRSPSLYTGLCATSGAKQRALTPPLTQLHSQQPIIFLSVLASDKDILKSGLLRSELKRWKEIPLVIALPAAIGDFHGR